VASIAAVTIGLPLATTAAEIPNDGVNGFTNPTTTTTTVNQFARVDLTMDWSVPPGTLGGDTIRQELPESLRGTSFGAFDVLDQDGRPIAVATLDVDPDGTSDVVFTFNDLVEEGSAGTFGEARFSLEIRTEDLVFDNGVTTIDVFGEPVTVNEGVIARDTSKFAVWDPDLATATALNDDGQLIQQTSHIVYYINLSPDTAGASDDDWTSGSFTEPASNGFRPDCTLNNFNTRDGMTIQYRSGGAWMSVPLTDTTRAQVVAASCGADGTMAVTLTKPAVDDEVIYRVRYRATITTNAAGEPIHVDEFMNEVVGFPDTFRNDASVTLGNTVTEVDTRLIVRDGSAEGELTNFAAIDIEKYSAASWEGVQFDADGEPDVGPAPDLEPTNQPDEDFDNAPGKELAPDVAQLVNFTITNIGSEDLLNVEVTDATTDGPALGSITCTFPDATAGTTWAGPFEATTAFTCTAALAPMGFDATHADIAGVTAVSAITRTAVADEDPWSAQTPPETTTTTTTTTAPATNTTVPETTTTAPETSTTAPETTTTLPETTTTTIVVVDPTTTTTSTTTIAPVPPPGGLPRTGGAPTGTLAVAALLLGAGIATLGLTRRRTAIM